MLNFKCPKCQTPIMVRNTGGLDQVKITCPNCQGSITVKLKKKPIQVNPQQAAPVVQPQVAQPQPAVQVQPQDDNETVFKMPLSNMGVPALVLHGVRYRLSLGHNVVGRESNNSTATMQLPVDDRYMSRVNAYIDVTKTDMGTWQVVVSSSNERNLVKVNGRAIDMGNRIILQDGNRLGLGHTELLFTFDK